MKLVRRKESRMPFRQPQWPVVMYLWDGAICCPWHGERTPSARIVAGVFICSVCKINRKVSLVFRGRLGKPDGKSKV